MIKKLDFEFINKVKPYFYRLCSVSEKCLELGLVFIDSSKQRPKPSATDGAKQGLFGLDKLKYEFLLSSGNVDDSLRLTKSNYLTLRPILRSLNFDVFLWLFFYPLNEPKQDKKL